MKKVLIVLGSFIFITGYSQLFGDKEKSFESWDADNDGKISKEEYNLNSEIFDRWDDNGDSRISQSEFHDSYFALFDSDSDGNLKSDELSDVYFLLSSGDKMAKKDKKDKDDESGEVRYGAGTETVQNLDADNDGSVSKDEFQSKSGELFNSWDSNNDNLISKTELSEKTFNWWDQDSNGSIEKSEFEEMKQVKKEQSFWEKIF